MERTKTKDKADLRSSLIRLHGNRCCRQDCPRLSGKLFLTRKDTSLPLSFSNTVLYCHSCFHSWSRDNVVGNKQINEEKYVKIYIDDLLQLVNWVPEDKQHYPLVKRMRDLMEQKIGVMPEVIKQ